MSSSVTNTHEPTTEPSPTANEEPSATNEGASLANEGGVTLENFPVDRSSEIMSEMFETLLNTTHGASNLVDTPLDDSTQTMPVSSLFDGMQDITASFTDTNGLASTIHPEMNELYAPTPSVLQVQYTNDDVKALYAERSANYETDSGWDLHFTEDATIEPGETKTLDFGVSVAGYTEEGEPMAVWLVPRSSIVKTPLRMANCIGLIDSSYRGTLKAVVDNIKTEPYTVKKGDRLFQIAAPTLRPMTWQPVEALTETERGTNGFGSTGK